MSLYFLLKKAWVTDDSSTEGSDDVGSTDDGDGSTEGSDAGSTTDSGEVLNGWQHYERSLIKN